MMLSSRYLFAVLAAAWLVPVQAAPDNTPDPAFAVNQLDSPPGWRRSYQYGGGAQNERIIAARRTPDGGYLLAGRVIGSDLGAKLLLHKVRGDGSNDPSFGANGRVVRTNTFMGTVTDMAIDTQGRIVVVGATPGALGQYDFGVLRFLSNGADDLTFAGDGSTRIAFDLDAAHSRINDMPDSVATLPDGSIFIAGPVQDVTGATAFTSVGLVKLKPDGSRDTTFGNSGDGTRVYCRAQCSDLPSVARLVYDAPRNRLVIGGDFAYSDNDTDWFLITQGLGNGLPSQTSTYAIDQGAASGVRYDSMTSVAVQADGKILASGYTATTSTLEIRGAVLRRLADSGTEDLTFGNTSGRGLYISPNDSTSYNDVAVDSLGRIIVAGKYGSTRRGLAQRLTKSGTPDPWFFFGLEAPYAAKTSGLAGPAGTSYSTMFQRVFLDGGKPVFAGESPDSETTDADYDTVLMRLDSDLIFANGFQ